LHQRRARQFVALFGDVPGALGFIGVLDFGHQAEIGGQLAGVGEVSDLADGAQQHGGADRSDALDAHQVFVAGQLGTFRFDQLFQLGDAAGQAGRRSGTQIQEAQRRASVFTREFGGENLRT